MEHSEVDWRECEVDNEESIKIKVENESTINTDTEEFGGTKTFEELYIKNEHLEGTDVSNSIKSEPDEVDWDQYDTDNKRILEMEAENNKLDMELYSQVKEELIFKDESDKNTDTVSGIVLSSMDNSNECATCENEDLNIQLSQMKPETDMDTQTRVDPVPDAASNRPAFELHTYIQCVRFRSKSALDDHVTEEHCKSIAPVCSQISECKHCTYKTTIKEHFENKCIHCDTNFKTKLSLDDHVLRKHPSFATSIDREIYQCTKCSYKTAIKRNFDRHDVSVHSEIVSSNSSTRSRCIHCGAQFKNKEALDDHIVRKHPDFITSVDEKIYECMKCSYKTVMKTNFDRHTSRHSGSDSCFMLRHCVLCDVTFKTTAALDNHVVVKHPDFVTSVDRKIYECVECCYKTTFENNFDRHNALVHPSSALNDKLIMCIQCKVPFKNKESLDDHIIRKHPDFITSADTKIYECIKCNYKTVMETRFDRHMAKHPDAASNSKLCKCIHCNASFKTNTALDNHVVRVHPNHITSVGRKIYECTKCVYKTTIKSNFGRHNALVHPVSAAHHKLITCIHCKEQFTNKESLDDHTARKHPDSITSVDKKIYECIKCNYKTVTKSHFGRHMSKHPEVASSSKLRKCIHCNATFKSNTALDNHVVKIHPNHISSVVTKIYECTKCVYKTTFKRNFYRHVLVH